MAFRIYKKGQGKYTRLGTAFALGIIAALGCWQLYVKLDAANFALSRRAALWVATMVPTALFVVLAWLIFWLVNKPSVADFMIASEGELKKVSWSTRQEVAVSTFIVIVVVAIFVVLLGVTDLVFRTFFDWLLQL